MNRAVWKYQLGIHDGPQLHEIPVGSTFVHGEMQGDTICLWFEVTTNGPEIRSFEVFGTGHWIPQGFEHRASMIHKGHDLVWHVYENPKP